MKKKSMVGLAISLLVCTFLIVTGATTISGVTNEKEIEQEQTIIFSDIKESDWYYDDVKYVQKNGLMSGTSKMEFSPMGCTTRGMIVTILWRLEGESAVEGKAFADVAQGAYYYNAVLWASENQIVSGYNETEFGPNDHATREQFATIMYRYALFKKLDTSKEVGLDKYSDNEQISGYAVKSLQWANAIGIITGTSDKTISPKDNVQRCQVAAILRRFCKNFNLFNEKAEAKQEESKNEESKNGVKVIGAGGGPDEPSIPKEAIPNEEKEMEGQRPTIKVNASYGDPGENIAVLVDISENPGILGMILLLEYDEDAMTLVGVENGEAVDDILTLTTSKDLRSGAKFVWDGLEIAPNQIKDGHLLKLNFLLSKDAIYGKKYPLTLKYDSGDIIDSNFDSISPLIKQGFIEINQEKY